MSMSGGDGMTRGAGAAMTASIPTPDDRAIVAFLKDLEEASDPDEVIRRHAALHPHLAGEFADLAAMRGRIHPPPGDPSAESRPERLGDFRVVGEIGRGGMGMIYEAVQEPLERRVAVKTIRGDLRRVRGTTRDRFLREQDVLARLHHTHIVPIHAAGCAGPLHYYAMQYIEGAALNQVIEATRLFGATSPSAETPSMAELADRAGRARGEKTSAPPRAVDGADADADADTTPHPTPDGATMVLAPEVTPSGEGPASPDGRLHLSMKYLRSVAKVMADAADALQHAHEARIFHRDVKPSNIMVDRQEHCWVLDFGLAALRAGGDGAGPGAKGASPGDPLPDGDGAAPLVTDDVIGTPAYMAPEQFERRFDARTDVWGLGLTLYELITLRRPFRSKAEILSADPPSPRGLVAGIPPDLEAICLRAMQRDPGQRYQTAGELRDDLRRWLRFEPTRARPARTARRVGLWARRNPGWAAAIGVTLVSAIVAVAAVIRSEEAGKKALASEVREARRASLMQRLQYQRLSAHDAGWSEDGWGLVREIKKIRTSDDLEEEAAATLLGIDATARKPIDFQPRMLAYDPSGRRLLMVGVDRGDPEHPRPPPYREEVRIRDSITGEVEDLSPGTRLAYGPVGFRADGTPLQLLWDKEGKGAVLLWDLAGRRAIRRLDWPLDPGTRPMAWTFTPGGAFAGVLGGRPDAEGKGHVVIWETATGKVLRQFPTGASDLELSPDGRLVATSDLDGRIAVWSLAGGERIASLSSGHTAILSMAFGRDYLKRAGEKAGGWLLAAGTSGGKITIWDIRAGIPRSYCVGWAPDVVAMAFSPDGMTLASVGRSRPMLWDVATGRLVLGLGVRDSMSSLAFTPDGRTLAVGARDLFGPGGLDIWRLEEARGQQVLRGLVGQVSQVCHSPDGRFLAALTHNWQLGIWDLPAHRLLHVFETPRGRFSEHAALAFDPEGKRLAFASGDGARMWDVQTGAEIRSWTLPFGFLDRMAFPAPDRLLLVRQESVDPRSLPFGANDPEKTPRVCRVRNLLGPDPRKPRVEIRDFPFNATAIIITPDGRRVIIEGIELDGRGFRRAIKMFETATGTRGWELRSAFVQQLERIGSVDPTGQFLKAVDEAFADVIMLDIASGRQVRTFRGRPVSLGPGARYGLSAGTDPENPDRRTYSLIRVDDEAPLVSLVSNDDPHDARFSADGARLAWGNRDGTVTVCDIRQIQQRLATIGLGW